MVLAVYGAQNNNLKMMKGWLMSTIGLGIFFLLFQVYEFRHFLHEGLGISTNQFGASFYLMTGFHGVHVGIGVIILISLLFGSFRRNSLGILALCRYSMDCYLYACIPNAVLIA